MFRYSSTNLGFYVNVDCKGDEANLANCTVTRNPLCNQFTTAGVSCNRGKTRDLYHKLYDNMPILFQDLSYSHMNYLL